MSLASTDEQANNVVALWRASAISPHRHIQTKDFIIIYDKNKKSNIFLLEFLKNYFNIFIVEVFYWKFRNKKAIVRLLLFVKTFFDRQIWLSCFFMISREIINCDCKGENQFLIIFIACDIKWVKEHCEFFFFVNFQF